MSLGVPKSVSGQTTWQLGEKVADGAFATVVYAQGSDGTRAAVKFLQQRQYLDPELKRRFRREILTLGKIDHPNVVSLLDHAVAQSGARVDYAVLEWCPDTLESYVERFPNLTLEERLSLIEQALRGVRALHDAGVVHRDLSPNNILLTADGVVKVADLGLGRHREDGRLTGKLQQLGKLHYTSPDQWKDLHGATAADDVFSLGQIAAFVLSGEPPLFGTALESHFEIPPTVQFAVNAMRDPRRCDRPQDARAALLSWKRAVAPPQRTVRFKIEMPLDQLDALRAERGESRTQLIRRALRSLTVEQLSSSDPELTLWHRETRVV